MFRALLDFKQRLFFLESEAPLEWAVDDMCPMHIAPGQAAAAALRSYRAAVLDFHRDTKRARYARVRDSAPQRPAAL